MIYSFTLGSIPVYVFDSPPTTVIPKALVYSFAVDSKTCLDICCSSCPIYSSGKCTPKLRQLILNQPDFISNYPELLV